MTDALAPALRPMHPPAHRSDAVARANASFKSSVVQQVIDAITVHDLVIVGMAWNQPDRQIRADLDRAELKYEYLQIGNYLNKWRDRLAIKLWTGWPTFPQVFVKGVFIGGRDLAREELASGRLKERLAAPRVWPA